MISCELEPTFPAKYVDGYKPIYAAAEPITFEASRGVYSPGKICRYKSYLLVSEANTGIHIIDNSNPQSPNFIGFLKIADNENMEVSDSILIVDYQNRLVSLNLSEITSIKEVSSVKAWFVTVPPVTNHYYECPDLSKEIIGWSLEQLHNPKCYR